MQGEASPRKQATAVKRLPLPTKAVEPMCLLRLVSKQTHPKMLLPKCKARSGMWPVQPDTLIQAVPLLHPAARTLMAVTAAPALGVNLRANLNKCHTELVRTRDPWALLVDCLSISRSIVRVCSFTLEARVGIFLLLDLRRQERY